ncbi:hypothetical protein MJ257_21890 [Paenibacillus timonensis]|uniref:Uncharacterized protein n=1 Tax=Paenibacillus timonensis TaxID=225915 RepID=A0ABW3SGV5_9BACL|nr:hypothetical protein [Paenibacillus timonensis]MCH1642753.1 hypothetical protein [Paenibacillus timonensis]
MFDNLFAAEYMMKLHEMELQKSTREAWKWSAVKSKKPLLGFILRLRHAKMNESHVTCCSAETSFAPCC